MFQIKHRYYRKLFAFFVIPTLAFRSHSVNPLLENIPNLGLVSVILLRNEFVGAVWLRSLEWMVLVTCQHIMEFIKKQTRQWCLLSTDHGFVIFHRNSMCSLHYSASLWKVGHMNHTTIIWSIMTNTHVFVKQWILR